MSYFGGIYFGEYAPGAGAPALDYLLGIPSSEAWGLPTVDGPTAVDLVGIPSVEAWGLPAAVLVAYLASIPSAEVWGLPVPPGFEFRIYHRVALASALHRASLSSAARRGAKLSSHDRELVSLGSRF